MASLMFALRVRSKQSKILDWAIAQLPRAQRAAIEAERAGRDRKSFARDWGIAVRRVDWLIWKGTKVLRKLVRRFRVTPLDRRSPAQS